MIDFLFVRSDNNISLLTSFYDFKTETLVADIPVIFLFTISPNTGQSIDFSR